MGVVAVAGENDVVIAQRADHTADHRFLPAVDVEITADLAAPKLALRRFLETADEDHLAQDVVPLGRTGRLIEGGGCLFFLPGHISMSPRA